MIACCSVDGDMVTLTRALFSSRRQISKTETSGSLRRIRRSRGETAFGVCDEETTGRRPTRGAYRGTHIRDAHRLWRDSSGATA